MNAKFTFQQNAMCTTGSKFPNCSNCDKKIDDKISTIQVENCLGNEISEILIRDAIAYIYGISWKDFNKHLKSTINVSPVLSAYSVVMCSSCASLLSRNYNSHQEFEWATNPNSIIQQVKNVNLEREPSETIDFEDKQNSEQLMSSPIEIKCEEDSFENSTGEEGTSNQCDAVEIKVEPILYYFDSDSVEENETMGKDSIFSQAKKLSVRLNRIAPQTVEYYKTQRDCITTEKPIRRTQRICIRKKILDNNDHEDSTSAKGDCIATEKVKRRLVRRRCTKKPTTDVDQDEGPILPLRAPKSPEEGEHRDSSVDTEEYKCIFCKKQYGTRKSLKRHLLTHEPGYIPKPSEKSTTVSCLLCDKKLSSETLRNHLKYVHDESERLLIPCEICGKQIRKYTMKDHMKVHVSRAEIKCDKCDKVYVGEEALAKHMKVHYPNFTPYLCKFCGKTYTHKFTCQEHEERHTKQQTFSFACQFCPKKFPKNSLLRQHHHVHTSERPFVCEECGKAFKVKDVLKKHLQRHKTEESGEYSAKCDECGAVFANSIRLKSHIDYQHWRKRNFQCSFCDKNLSTLKALTRHENLHKNKPNFKPRKKVLRRRLNSTNAPTNCIASDEFDTTSENCVI